VSAVNRIEIESRLQRYQDFLAHDPNNLNLGLEVIDLHTQLGNFSNAETLIRASLEKHPDDPSLQSRQATLAMAGGRAEEAVTILQALVARGISPPAVLYNYGYALLLCRRFEEAKDLLQTHVNDPDALPQTKALFLRALHHLGDLDAAIAQLQSSTSNREQTPDAHGVAALIYLDAGDLEAARREADAALQRDAKNLEALVTRGTLALEEHEEAPANDFFSNAVAAHPKSGRAWSGMGLAHMLGMNVPQAIEDLKKAVQYMPNHIGTWHALAWCQIVTNDLEGAKESFNKANEVDHSFGETYGGLAVVSVLQGQTGDAHENIKRALRLDPMSFSARFAQSLLMVRMGKPEAAQELIQKILSASVLEGGESLQSALTRIFKKRNLAQNQRNRLN
jgi:tetratricopeptide (TPR) repeat protein